MFNSNFYFFAFFIVIDKPLTIFITLLASSNPKESLSPDAIKNDKEWDRQIIAQAEADAFRWVQIPHGQS
jgi:hypothetical protein